MALHRYSFSDPYIVAELRGRYEAAGPRGRIKLLAELYKSNDSRPPYEIAALAVGDSSVVVRRWVAKHGRYLDYEERRSEPTATAPSERNLRERLKSDPDPLVRAQLRENPDILGVIGIDESQNWFRDSSHTERLALVRNPKIIEEFIERLFDPSDAELQISQNERFELCCAFLTNRAAVDKHTKDAGWGSEHRPSSNTLGALASRHLLNALWFNASKWPKGSGNLQYAVYSHVPAADETKAKVYEACDEPVWRRAILYNSDAARDAKTFDVAVRDSDDRCRELAYERVATLSEKQIAVLLKSGDRAALRGLADNRVLPGSRQADVHERVRARLQELGESTTAYEDFDLMHLEGEREAASSRGSVELLAGRLDAIEQSVREITMGLDSLSRLFSIPTVIGFVCFVGFVAALFVRWLR
jgi:hypothetical protein